MEFLLEHEPQIRLGAFLGTLSVMVLWEFLGPRLTIPRRRRWPENISIVVVNTVLVRLIFPILPIGAAVHAHTQGWGVLNQIDLPGVAAVIIVVAALDLAIYGQHILFHKIPILWRLHRMHHADTGFDATTGVRFHPIEIVLSIAIKMGFVIVIGAPAAAVMIFEVLLSAASVFNHANVNLTGAADRTLRLIVVTPDMHRVHHSSARTETDSNFGFNVPWWDHVFGTYRDQPDLGHDGMQIGLPEFRDADEQRLDKLMTQPFR